MNFTLSSVKMLARCYKSKLRLNLAEEFLKHFFILNCQSVIGRHLGTRLSPLHLDNTYDYGDNCTFVLFRPSLKTG